MLYANFLADTLTSILKNIDERFIPSKTRYSSAILENLHRVLSVRNSLADEQSKAIYDSVVAMYLASAFLPSSSTTALFHTIKENEWKDYIKQAHEITSYAAGDYILDRIETWILEGYSYQDVCRAQPGDYVIDGGAYTGNTALYFESLVGEEGKVFSFEPAPQTYAQLKKNITNSGFKNIISIQEGLADTKKVCRFNVKKNRAASSISDEGAIEVQINTIDEFVKEQKIEHIDFIKMDIEGAELAALEGARKTITKHQPKLAICVYHMADDIITVPEKILSINPQYTFYLKHNCPTYSELVLFAVISPLTRNDNFLIENVESSLVLYNATHSWARHSILKLYFNSICHYFMTLCNIPFEFIYTYAKCYVYMPFSLNKQFHYEIMLHNSSVDVCLHIENALSHLGQDLYLALKNWLVKLADETPELRLDIQESRLGCYIRIIKNECEEEHLLIAQKLEWLIRVTLFQLNDFDLVSDEIRNFL